MSTEIKHSERAHARLSASGSTRWINCPASPALEEGIPEETSCYAEEGTLAHELSEAILCLDLGFMTMALYKNKIEAIKADKYYCQEMWDEVAKYVTYVKEQFKEAKRQDKNAKILIEEKLDLTEWIPGGFGTSDVIIICNQGIEVIDLKYGKGKAVYADNNTQLMSYGRGAMKVAEKICTFAKVSLTIVQPRLDNISRWSLSTKELREWGEKVLKVKAVETENPDAKAVAGDWCQYCKARAKCRALYDLGMEIAKQDFEVITDPRLLNDEELLTAYESADFITKWLGDVKATVLKEALSGKKWDGYKLVEGRSNRQFISEEKVVEALEAQLYGPKDYLNFKLKGLGDLEKLLGKKDFSNILDPLLVKPKGAPTLVRADDKREEFGKSQINEDFAEELKDFEDENDL